MQGIRGYSPYAPPSAYRVDTTTPAFARPCLETLKKYREQVDRYDAAAPPSDPSFLSAVGTRFLKWSGRGTVGLLANEIYTLPGNNPFRKIAQSQAYLYEGRKTYFDLLGLKDFAIKKETSWLSFFSKEDKRKAFKRALQLNFSNFLKLEMRERLTLTSYLKNTVFKYNVGNILSPIAEKGYLGTGLSTIYGMVTSLWKIIPDTIKSYQRAKENNKNTLTSTVDASLTCAKETTKAILSWEIGSIGYAIGLAAMPLGPVPRLIAGWLTGSFIGTIASTFLNKILPD